MAVVFPQLPLLEQNITDTQGVFDDDGWRTNTLFVSPRSSALTTELHHK